jgi:CheY-like chemotaxis protein
MPRNVNRRELLTIFANGLAAAGLTPLSPILPPPLDLEKLTAKRPILVGDIEPYIAQNLYDMFTYEKLHSIKTNDPYEALHICRMRPISLLLIDFIFPVLRRMDTVDFVQQLKSGETTRYIPFIFLSAMADKPARKEGMALGAEAYITKPFSVEEILYPVRRTLITRVDW